MTEEIDWSKLTSKSLGFYNPPKPNWKIYFGNDRSDFCFQFYIKNPPNRFQRWMFRKILGIKWEPVT